MAIITKRRKAYSVVYQKVDENGVTKQIWETYYDYSSALVRKREIENEGIHIKMNIKPNTTILNFYPLTPGHVPHWCRLLASAPEYLVCWFVICSKFFSCLSYMAVMHPAQLF